MIFKIMAGGMYMGLLSVGSVGHVWHKTNRNTTIYRRNRVAKIASYKSLRLIRVY